jgi:hypothetical protein
MFNLFSNHDATVFADFLTAFFFEILKTNPIKISNKPRNERIPLSHMKLQVF